MSDLSEKLAAPVPDAAVEAAMIAFAQAPVAPYDPPTNAAEANLNNRAQMTLALEAAAPHILAEADETCCCGTCGL